MNVLVTYATRHGATQGIAERIAERLRRPGLDVSLLPVNETSGLEGFDAFVIGSAAYMGGWLGDAVALVRRQRALLSGRPVWLFSSGPIGDDQVDAKGRDQLQAARPREFDEFDRTLRPRGVRVFFGAWDPSASPTGIAERLMGRFLRLMPAARDAMPVGDFRDWPAIDAWADRIADELLAAGSIAAAGPAVSAR